MDKDRLIIQSTQDGSSTFFDHLFKESFHSHFGAKEEAEKKFVLPCRLAELAKNSNSLQILDICYGLGYNSCAALETIWAVNPECKVKLIALEIEPKVYNKAIAEGLLSLWQPPVPQLLTQLAVKQEIKESNLEAKLLVGDGRITIGEINQLDFQADAIFLDPFSPPKCPQLWTIEFLEKVAQCLKQTGILATYSCAAAVRIALQKAGLNIGSSESVGRSSPGTVASFTDTYLPPLSLQEREHLQTRAAIPYRDPTLKDCRELILKRREKEQQASLLEPTTHWKKRWLNK